MPWSQLEHQEVRVDLSRAVLLTAKHEGMLADQTWLYTLFTLPHPLHNLQRAQWIRHGKGLACRKCVIGRKLERIKHEKVISCGGGAKCPSSTCWMAQRCVAVCVQEPAKSAYETHQLDSLLPACVVATAGTSRVCKSQGGAL